MLSDQLKRREFITLLGGAAAAWPSAAPAQQPAMPVIGFLNPYSPDGQSDRVRGFRQGLAETGYVEGVSLAIEYRWAEGQFDRLSVLAAELARRQVAVIAATGSVVSALAAEKATTTIPIVFVVAEDPVRLGLVANLARPAGNLTGINFLSAELVAKRLALLREFVPGTARVAVLVNPANARNTETTLHDVQAAARAMGLQISQVLNASSSGEINAAFASLGRERPDALFVGGDAFFNTLLGSAVFWFFCVNAVAQEGYYGVGHDGRRATAGGWSKMSNEPVDREPQLLAAGLDPSGLASLARR
jgi:putative ABC transport system substrate-binding protein